MEEIIGRLLQLRHQHTCDGRKHVDRAPSVHCSKRTEEEIEFARHFLDARVAAAEQRHHVLPLLEALERFADQKRHERVLQLAKQRFELCKTASSF